MDVKNSVLELIGNTPLVRLNKAYCGETSIYAKLEYRNPGGSVKDRIGYHMVKDAMDSGRVKKGATIIEPTAGNTGIGIALASALMDFKTVFVMPEKFSEEKRTIMRALGAKVVTTPTEGGMEGAISKALELEKEIEGSIVLQQFSNPANAKAHYETTGKEIFEQMDGKVGAFVAGVGTSGTFTGAARFLKESIPGIYTAAVEPAGSILGGGPPGRHKTEGIGVDDLKTAKLFDRGLADEIITIGDEAAHSALKQLAREEGMLAGSSAGAACAAAIGVAKRIDSGEIKAEFKSVAVIFPDGSDRYLSKKIYGDFDEWF